MFTTLVIWSAPSLITELLRFREKKHDLTFFRMLYVHEQPAHSHKRHSKLKQMFTTTLLIWSATFFRRLYVHEQPAHCGVSEG